MKEDIIRISQQELENQKIISESFKKLEQRPQTYYIVTFGCQMNAHDSEKLAGMLENMGLRAAPSREEADFVLHNTCCVRDNAERKALGNVTWLKEIKKEKPGLLIGVCGCMVQEKGMAEKLLKQYPFVDLAFGTGNIHQLPQLLYQAAASRQRTVCVPENQSTVAENLPIVRQSASQAYVTVMYGCNNFCSYCIVPYVRGRERSRYLADILHEVDGLVKNGCQEIMLLGQNVNSYGKDLEEGHSFAQLLHEVSKTGIPRIRFMTSHPKDLSDELIEEIAQNPQVMRHFHLPVQSGSDRILQMMNRRYSVQQYLDRVDALRRAVPDIGITTDLIVGFPGEEESDFQDTMELVRQVGYDAAFTFIYSPRTGTVAEKLPGRIDPAESTRRIEALIALQETKTKEVFERMIGSRQSVLVSGFSKRNENQITGKCSRNISVNFEGDASDEGKILPVLITSAGKTTLRGTKIPE